MAGIQPQQILRDAAAEAIQASRDNNDATAAETFQRLNGYDEGSETYRGGYVQFSSDGAAAISGIRSATLP